jgi:Leucine-rich repeat (LRR) protein
MERELESALESETKVLDEHLLRNDNAGICPRPLSARSRFLNGCLQSKLAPRPSLIIRKDQTATLNLEHQYMGDAAAILLASSLDGLPHVAEINIADNKLTDIGLTAIIKALNKCPFLTSLDISENKLDSEAAASLSQYLSSPSCFLINLVLRKSDVDDNEIGRFVNVRIPLIYEI